MHYRLRFIWIIRQGKDTIHRAKTGRPISLTSYQRYNKIALNENAASSWIDHFARIGFVEHYHKRINEVERLQEAL